MYDKYLIVENSLRSTPDGIEFDVRVAYYRSVALSMVDAFKVSIDGEPVPAGDIRFVLRGDAYSQIEMDDESAVRWEFGEIATIRVHRRHPLEAGSHQVGFAQSLRIIYMPGGILRGEDTKTLELSSL
ncbi:MAG: C-glycoside deglycosidase beta subunit domain-containing protein [Microbacterium sp.]|uniref:C-glycoside deglycosidase beta subunit domain-containing protein n=1 Tax=Microbacterium sp. TaxID=51671 RepID=UPI003F7E676A